MVWSAGGELFVAEINKWMNQLRMPVNQRAEQTVSNLFKSSKRKIPIINSFESVWHDSQQHSHSLLSWWKVSGGEGAPPPATFAEVRLTGRKVKTIWRGKKIQGSKVCWGLLVLSLASACFCLTFSLMNHWRCCFCLTDGLFLYCR